MKNEIALLKNILDEFVELPIDADSSDNILYGYNLAIRKLRDKINFMISQLK